MAPVSPAAAAGGETDSQDPAAPFAESPVTFPNPPPIEMNDPPGDGAASP